MERIKGYPKGTAAKIGDIVLLKWSDSWWSAGKRSGERVWATSALRALRVMQAGA